jgi:hypothetical protein
MHRWLRCWRQNCSAARARRFVRNGSAFPTALLLLGLPGCGGGDEQAEGAPSGAITLADANNYSSDSSLSIPVIETASATDLDICWSGVVKDLQCHDLMPQADLDTVALLRFLRLSEDEVEAKLTAGQLQQRELDGYLEHTTTHTASCAKLSAMSFFGTPIEIEQEYVESQDHTYMMVFSRGTTPGVGAQAMVFVKPSARSNNTRVDAPSGCGLLDFSASLSSVERLSVPEAGPWVVDWRSLTRDGQGNDIDFQSIDGVRVGFFAGLDVPDIERQILDLEQLATTMWELELTGGRTADLAEARTRDGNQRFAGFQRDEAGVWLLALTCSTCQNPAPIVLSVLEPAPGTP